jgi:hypothetical protein
VVDVDDDDDDDDDDDEPSKPVHRSPRRAPRVVDIESLYQQARQVVEDKLERELDADENRALYAQIRGFVQNEVDEGFVDQWLDQFVTDLGG